MAIRVTASDPADPVAAARVLDADLRSVWSSTGSPARVGGWLQLDLWTLQEVGRVRWYVALPEAAQDYDVRMSADGVVWSGVTSGSRLRATVVGWEERYLRTTIRYIQFVFYNRTRTASAVVGGLAAVEIYRP